MKLTDNGYKIITTFEGLSLKPYLDSVKIPTIGYGSTYYEDGTKVKMTDKQITHKEALEMFKSIADTFAKKVDALIAKPINQNQFNAVVSLAYNIGINGFKNSTLLRKLNINPDDPTIRNEFMKWNKAGGKEIQGLTNRRKMEADIYFLKIT